MLVAALVIAALAAVLHVYIFAMESLLWTTPKVRAAFGLSEQEARASRVMAFNQGFYNLLLAIVAGAGIVAWAAGSHAVGAALVIAGVGSMLAASLVLVVSDRTKASAAVKQGALPLLALIALAISAF